MPLNVNGRKPPILLKTKFSAFNIPTQQSSSFPLLSSVTIPPVKLSDFLYDLPQERIATHPITPRDHSKLMVVHRDSGSIEHAHFHELSRWVTPEDLLLLNNTKVIPARLHADAGTTEILLIEETSPRNWVAIGKPGKRLKAGTILELIPSGPSPTKNPPAKVEILKSLEDGTRIVRLLGDFKLEDYGQLPLPPYIQKARLQHNEPDYLPEDNELYQTIYAQQPGSVAAPTAGLHFTPELLQKFQHDFITLNVGLGTFRPVKVENLEDHPMHTESYEVPDGLAEKIKQAGRVIAVGTTTARVLESNPKLRPGPGQTNIFIHPPYRFKRTDALITNFHLPGSTLLMLVAAMMGVELQRKAYQAAIENNYRFFSYGDAMLIV
jgi:S-adenosylmethionine:tRNA ribosyltransferase-isomerase